MIEDRGILFRGLTYDIQLVINTSIGISTVVLQTVSVCESSLSLYGLDPSG